MMPLSDDVADKVVPSIFHIWNDISGRKEGLVSRVSYPIHHLIIKCPLLSLKGLVNECRGKLYEKTVLEPIVH